MVSTKRADRREDKTSPAEPELTLSDQAYSIIETAIIRGELPAGTRLSEPALAARFGLSRSSLREAFIRLEGKKLLSRTPRLGVRVVSLSITQLREIYELREALEGLSCRLATDHMSDEEVSLLDRLLEQHVAERTIPTDGYFQLPGDRDFHFFIAQGSQNKMLQDMLCNELYHFLRIYRYRSSTGPGRASAALAEHKRIFMAIRERDPDKAEALMRAHVRRSWESLLRREMDTFEPE